MPDLTTGICCLCGCYGALTFEHIPPRSAFNDMPLVSYSIDRILSPDAASEFKKPTGGTARKGAGGFTLCGRCNSRTGAWYGNAYAQWAAEGVRLLDAARNAPSLAHLAWLKPLEVIKQVACMFFSINGPRFREVHKDLAEFVLNPKRKYWPSEARIFVALSSATLSKMVGVSGIGNFERHSFKVVSEMMHPPFCYVMLFKGEPTHRHMYDMTHFAKGDFGHYSDYWMRLPILTSATPFPGDYRSRKEVFEKLG